MVCGVSQFSLVQGLPGRRRRVALGWASAFSGVCVCVCVCGLRGKSAQELVQYDDLFAIKSSTLEKIFKKSFS